MSIKETMNNLERFEAAVSLDYVDRHPVFPILVVAAPRLCGITQGEAWRNHVAARESLIRCYKEYGYDLVSKPNYYYSQLPGKFLGAPVRNLIPGKQLEEDYVYQVDERVLFPREDYDRIAALGWNRYWEEHYEKMSGKSFAKLVASQRTTNDLYNEDMKICEENEAPVFLGAAVDSVLMAFSLCRTLEEFTMDLYEVPDKVEAAMRASVDDLISNAIEVCKANGKNRAFIVLERGSGYYYRMELFERFEWPFLQQYVDAFLSEGILPWLHLDTDWGMNLPYFKKLPKGKCVCDLDGATDIFKAKEILKGHMCISGDVPAPLLSIGEPEEVETYCKRLIDEVGEGGGFMLTTGCECPVDVKPENLRAMIETGKNYVGKKRDKIRPSAVIEEAAVAEPGLTTFTTPKGNIAESIAQLRHTDVKRLVTEAISEGMDPFKILEECRDGMDVVGNLYSSGEYFLSELMLSAKIFKEVMPLIEPLIAKKQEDIDLGAIVIGTPKGDIHDIGKNIVATLFKAGGFQVFDVGVDVPAETFVQKIIETGAKIVGMSVLITPAIESMKNIVALIKEKGLREGRFIIIGGASTTDAVRRYVGADAWTLDPKKGTDMCRSFALDVAKSKAGEQRIQVS